MFGVVELASIVSQDAALTALIDTIIQQKGEFVDIHTIGKMFDGYLYVVAEVINDFEVVPPLEGAKQHLIQLSKQPQFASGERLEITTTQGYAIGLLVCAMIANRNEKAESILDL